MFSKHDAYVFLKKSKMWKCGGIFQDHDVMYMSINHGKFINDFREHGRVAMRESLHKHRRGDEWTN